MTRAPTRFTVSVAPQITDEPVTGRVFVVVTKSVDRPYTVASGPGEIGGTEHGIEPRLQAGQWKNRVPFFGTYKETVPYFSPWVGSVPFFGQDVDQLAPGETAIVDETATGFPLWSLTEIPAGEYYVQAVFNRYTLLERSDGHSIWAHMDQWEGQHWNKSAGNPVSSVMKVHLDPESGFDIHIELGDVLPDPQIPEDTEWVRRIKIQSGLLSEFWGRPIHLGATALLPRGFDDDPGRRYPVIYQQGHFSLGAPFGFSPEYSEETEESAYMRRLRGLQSGYDLYKEWISDDFPRVIAVTLQHPTPFFDDSYGVDSANNGPYGRAIMEELIPALEEEWRAVPEPHARTLTGGSTGGWISLALQVKFPDFYGGCWAFAPDSVDLRRYGLVNIYNDDNAFFPPNREWLIPERTFYRSPDGQPEITMRQISQFELALGTRGRSSEQLDAWQAVLGPVGEDGYPRELWDKKTGVIDRDVADYMKANGYDLRYYISENWESIGPDLVGKLHIYTADQDDYFLNLGVYPLEDFLENTTNPYYGGSFTYGRPLDGHVWHPMNQSELIRLMADHMSRRGQRPRRYSSMPAEVAYKMGESPSDAPGIG